MAHHLIKERRMPKDKEFVNRSSGLTVSAPSSPAQAKFICCTLRLYPEQLIEFLAKKSDQEMVKIDVKIYDGKNLEAPPLYLEVNTYQSAKPTDSDDKPF
tara:strand:- start:764 stop:1063 length:300 start_codon:yes stop_codon:yes gene_type:complete